MKVIRKRLFILLLGICTILTIFVMNNYSQKSSIQFPISATDDDDDGKELLRSLDSILALVSNSSGSTGVLVNEPALCRINFVLAGKLKNYTKTFAWNWEHHTRQDPEKQAGSCRFELIDSNHYLLKNMVTLPQQQVINTISSKAIVQADYMKLLAMFYLGGVVTDLDIEPMVQYPQGWFSKDLGTDDCSVVFGVEHGEWDPKNLHIHGYVSPGQILTYIMAAQRPGSPFLSHLLQAVGEKILHSPGFAHIPRIQDIAGSGTISDTIRAVMGKDYGQVLGSLRNNATLKDDDAEIVKFSFKGETVCILGLNYLGYNKKRWADLAHHWFQSSWRSDA